MTITFHRIVILLICTAIVVELALLAYNHKAFIATYTWEQYRVAPDILLTIYPNSSFAEDIGDYYLSWGTYDPEAYDREKAEKYYQYAHERSPEQSSVTYKLGLIDFIDGNFGNAHLKLTSIIEDSEVPVWERQRARYIRGLLYGYAKQFSKAEKDFMHLIEAPNADGWAYYVDLAWVYFQQGKYGEIEKLAVEGLKRFPENSWLLSTYGVALLNTDQKEKAARIFEKAREKAQQLTPEQWAQMYPGNNPADAKSGLKKMRDILRKNHQLATSGIE